MGSIASSLWISLHALRKGLIPLVRMFHRDDEMNKGNGESLW
jgi:hypothetical protein